MTVSPQAMAVIPAKAGIQFRYFRHSRRICLWHENISGFPIKSGMTGNILPLVAEEIHDHLFSLHTNPDIVYSTRDGKGLLQTFITPAGVIHLWNYTMVLDPNIKDNLMLMGNQDNPRYLMPLLVLLAGAIIAVILFYSFAPHKGRSKTSAVEAGKKPVASAKVNQRMMGAVKMMIASNNFALARQQCYELLQNTADPAILAETEKMLGQINMNIILSPAPMPEKMEYTVKSGDILENLAKKNGTTVDLIQKCNSLRGKMIHPGDRLRIFNAKLTIIISKGRNDLLLKANNMFFKRYAVGSGKFGTTPVGTFVISDKISEPPWWRPDGKMIPFGDKENVLGTRWMSLVATGETPKVRGYGIHGTWEPDTIGKQASAGCVRLVNSDVEELFLIVPAGTPVTIVE